jgi:putative exosortase-associated protein (TIGR04073 family)
MSSKHAQIRSRIRILCLAASILALLAAPGAVFADEPIEEMTAARKLGRGVMSILTGWLEVPGNMVQEGREHGALYGATVGLFMGSGKFVARELIGAYEVLTAPFAAPPGYQPILEPEFPWQYFDAQPSELYGLRNTSLARTESRIASISGAEVRRRDGALIVQFPEDLNFEPGSATLTARARRRLKQLARAIEDTPETRLFVKGFADTSGAEPWNLKLSTARAYAVSGFLAERGVSPNRIDTEGFGSAVSVADNATEAGRRSNRRVEIELRAGGVAARR